MKNPSGCLRIFFTLFIIFFVLGLAINNPIVIIGLLVAIWGFYEWRVNRKIGAKSKKPIAILIVGLLLTAIVFSSNPDTENAIDENNLAKEQIKQESQTNSIDTQKLNDTAVDEDTNSIDNEHNNEVSVVEPDTSESTNLITAKVINIVDGDTIDVELDGQEERVKLNLIHTPETRDPNQPAQPFGPEAVQFTKEHLENKEVQLEIDSQERDKYGRLLAYIWIGEKLYNESLIENGLARIDQSSSNTKYLDELKETEDQAMKKGDGIWSIDNYVHDDGFKEPPKSIAATSSDSQQSKQTGEQSEKQETEVETVQKQECNIKGSNSGIYHVPGSTYYNKTKNVAQWFCSVEEAEKAGYRAPKR